MDQEGRGEVGDPERVFEVSARDHWIGCPHLPTSAHAPSSSDESTEGRFGEGASPHRQHHLCWAGKFKEKAESGDEEVEAYGVEGG